MNDKQMRVAAEELSRIRGYDPAERVRDVLTVGGNRVSGNRWHVEMEEIARAEQVAEAIKRATK